MSNLANVLWNISLSYCLYTRSQWILNRNVITLWAWRRVETPPPPFEYWISASLYHKHSSAAFIWFNIKPKQSHLIWGPVCLVWFLILVNLFWDAHEEILLPSRTLTPVKMRSKIKPFIWAFLHWLGTVWFIPLLKITVEEWKGLFRVCLCCRPRVCVAHK